MKSPKNSDAVRSSEPVKNDQMSELEKSKNKEKPTTEGPLAEKDEVKKAEERTQKAQAEISKKVSDREANAEKGE
jgi:hypothetical protein